jgi:hypothetical protein
VSDSVCPLFSFFPLKRNCCGIIALYPFIRRIPERLQFNHPAAELSRHISTGNGKTAGAGRRSLPPEAALPVFYPDITAVWFLQNPAADKLSVYTNEEGRKDEDMHRGGKL